jgi:hypothetical protein
LAVGAKDIHCGLFDPLSFITVSKANFTRALHLPERFRHPIYRRVLPVLKLDPVTLIGQPSG